MSIFCTKTSISRNDLAILYLTSIRIHKEKRSRALYTYFLFSTVPLQDWSGRYGYAVPRAYAKLNQALTHYRFIANKQVTLRYAPVMS